MKQSRRLLNLQFLDEIRSEGTMGYWGNDDLQDMRKDVSHITSVTTKMRRKQFDTLERHQRNMRNIVRTRDVDVGAYALRRMIRDHVPLESNPPPGDPDDTIVEYGPNTLEPIHAD